MIGRKQILLGIMILAAVLGGFYLLDRAGGAGRKAPPATAVNPSGAAAAPDFKLKDMDGKEVRLEDFRGKKVLINFWTTWCTYCREEMPLLQKFHEQHGGRNWQVLTINITSSEKGVFAVRTYLQSNKYTFPVLLDETGSVASLYGVRSIPASFVLNEKGEVIKTRVGPFTWKEMADLISVPVN